MSLSHKVALTRKSFEKFGTDQSEEDVGVAVAKHYLLVSCPGKGGKLNAAISGRLHL